MNGEQNFMPEALASLEQDLDRVMAGGGADMDRQTYVGLYTLIHNYCVTGKTNPTKAELGPSAHLLGEELYTFLDDYLKRYLQTVHAQLVAKAEDELVDSYAEKWRRYIAAAKYNQRLFRFLEWHWIQRERDEGKAGILGIYPLHLARWKDIVLEKGDATVNRNLRERIERVGPDAESTAIEALTESFVALDIDDAGLQRQPSSSSLNSWCFIDDPEQSSELEGEEVGLEEASKG